MTANCASLINGTTQEVTINSDPAGAKLVIDNRLYEKSPVVIEVSRKKDIAGRLKKDGYEDESFIIERNFSKWAFLDLLIPPAFIFDLYTGGAYVFEKDRYYVEMEFEKESPVKQEAKYRYIDYVPPTRTIVRGAPLLSSREIFPPESITKKDSPQKPSAYRRIWDAKGKKFKDNMEELKVLQAQAKEIIKKNNL